MRRRTGSIVLGVTLALAACRAADERQWMKVNENYTLEDFRRDHATCSKGGRLDEACMRSRGWVAVNPSKPDKPTEPPTSPRYAPLR